MKRTKVILLGLLLTLGLLVQTTTDARVLNVAHVPLLVAGEPLPLVEQVGAIGMTVSDMDRSVDFYSRVLSFEKVSDVEVTGETYERLQGVFGLRMRVVRMRLGDEFIELTEYLGLAVIYVALAACYRSPRRGNDGYTSRRGAEREVLDAGLHR